MATRKPIVVVSGLLSELFPGDSIEGALITTSLTAGSGLSGGGALSSSQRVDVSLAAAPSGLIFVGNQLGLDGTAQAAVSSAATAQASGNAALASAATAQTSGNAALSRAGGTMTGPIVFANGQQINTSVNLSGGISGAVPYQSAPSSTTFLSPGVSGQVLATQGSNQIPRWITPGGGKILQAVQSTLTTTFLTTSIDYVSTGLTLSITPSSTSSRILVIASVSHYTNQGSYSRLTIFRNDSTNLLTNTFPGFTNIINYAPAGGYNNALAVTFNFIDSPSTTSATTYSVYVGCTTGSPFTFAYFNRFNYSGDNNAPGTAVLQAFEIAP
jgi:hypothetical protein